MNAGSPPIWLTRALKELLEERTKGQAISYQEWEAALQKALGRFQGAGIDTQFLSELIPHTKNPEFLLWFSKEIAGLRRHREDPQLFWQKLWTHIQLSPYKPGQWVESFEIVWGWLRQQHKVAPVTTCLNYLCCCEEAAQLNPLPVTLADQTREFLGSQGMAEAQDSPPS